MNDTIDGVPVAPGAKVITSGKIIFIDETEIPMAPKAPPKTGACSCGAAMIAVDDRGLLTAHTRGLVPGGTKCNGAGKLPLPFSRLAGSKGKSPEAAPDAEASVEAAAPPAPVVKLRTAPKTKAADAPNAIRSVATTIKGGGKLTGLGPLVALVGPNRSGKTTILDAIRLALTGTHPIGERRLFELAPANASEMFAEVIAAWGSVGVTVVRKLDGTVSRPKMTTSIPGGKPRPDDLPRTLPALSTAEMLEWGEARVRAAVFRRFGGEEITEKIPGLSADAAKLWEALLAAERTDDKITPADHVDLDLSEQFANALEAARKERLRLNREADQRETEYERRRAEIAEHGDVSDAAIEVAEQALADARAFAAFAGVAARLESAKTHCAEVEAAARAAPKLPPEPPAPSVPVPDEAKIEDFKRMRAAIAEARAKTQAARALVAKLEGELAGIKVAEDGTCGTCGATDAAERITARQEAIKVRLGKAPMAIAKLERAEAEAQRLYDSATTQERADADQAAHHDAVARREYDTIRAERARLGAAVKAARSAVAALEATLADGPQDPGVTESAARAKLEALRAAQAHLGDLSTLQTQAIQLRQTAQTYGQIEKEGARVLAESLTRVAAEAADAVNEYLPAGKRAQLVLVENGRRTCRWSIVGTDGQPHSEHAASGSEWALLVTALSLAWPESVGPRYVLLDDAELGPLQPPLLTEMLATLAQHVQRGTVSQVFVALGPDRAGCLGAEWQQITMGGEA